MVELLLEAVERGIPAPESPERLRRPLETLRHSHEVQPIATQLEKPLIVAELFT